MANSDIAQKLAAKISPSLVSNLDSREDVIVANSGGFMVRQAIRLGWPIAMREVPTVTEAGANALLDELGSLSIADLAMKLVQHNTQRGIKTHPTLASAATRHS